VVASEDGSRVAEDVESVSPAVPSDQVGAGHAQLDDLLHREHLAERPERVVVDAVVVGAHLLEEPQRAPLSLVGSGGALDEARDVVLRDLTPPCGRTRTGRSR